MFFDNWGLLRIQWVILLIVTGIAAFLALIFGVILAVAVPVGHATCTNWGKQTGLHTKFVRLNFSDTGTCLAQTPDGRWVKNTQVQEFITGDTPSP